MAHQHICKSRFHEGPRIRSHYDDRCTELYESNCLECSDEDLASHGATWEYADNISFSDADSGL